MLGHHTKKKSLGACGAKSALVSGFGVGKKLKFALTNFFGWKSGESIDAFSRLRTKSSQLFSGSCEVRKPYVL